MGKREEGGRGRHRAGAGHLPRRRAGNAARWAPNCGRPMRLQKMCASSDGSSAPVRRSRNAQWNPNRLVYASWNTVCVALF